MINVIYIMKIVFIKPYDLSPLHHTSQEMINLFLKYLWFDRRAPASSIPPPVITIPSRCSPTTTTVLTMWSVSSVTVALGKHNDEKTLKGGWAEKYKVQSIIRNPEYNLQTKRSDIALLRLDRIISFESRKDTVNR